MESRNSIEIFKPGIGNLAHPGQKPVAETLATRLREARLRKSWTQQELATRASTSQAVIQKIENGKSLRPRIIGSIAKALEVDPSWLMFGVSEIEELSPEAITLAKAWSKLPEIDRVYVRFTVAKLLTAIKRPNGRL